MSAERDNPARKKHRLVRRIIIPILAAIVGASLLWFLPKTRQQILIWVFGSPPEIVLPILTSPNAIQPGTVKDVRLLERWGNGTFLSMAWSPDERLFVVSTTLGINLYDGRSYQLLRYVRLPLKNIYGLAISPDSTQLAAAAEPGNILLFDLAKNEILRQWELDRSIFDLVYLADGTLICIADAQSGGTAQDIMKLENDQWQVVKALDEDYLLGTTFVSDKQAFLVFYKNSARLIDPVSGSEETLPYTMPYGDALLTHGIFLTVDRDNYLMSTYRNGSLVSRTNLDGLANQILDSPDGSILVTLIQDAEDYPGDVIKFWRISDLALIDAVFIPGLSPYVYNQIVFSPGGERLALLVSPSEIRMFSVNAAGSVETTLKDPYAGIADLAITSGGEIRAVSCSETVVDVLELPSANPIDEWYFDEPTCGQILADAATIPIAEPYENIYLYQIGELVMPSVICGNCCTVFSSNGSVGVGSGGIGSSGDPVTVTIWQKQVGLVQTWKFHNAGWDAFNVAVSPTGYYVAASGPPGTYLWVHGVKNGVTYPSLLSRMAFSPDERYLASADGILNLETGQVASLEKDPITVCSPRRTNTPTFSPDGRILAAEVCGALHFWQVSDGTLLARLDDPDITDQKLIFSPDGTFLAGLGKGFVNVWGITDVDH